MATYGTDLTTFNDAESGSWYEATATSPEAWNVGDNPGAESDYFIQGAGCRSSDTNNKTGICSGAYDAGSDQSGLFTSGVTVVLLWHVLLPGNAMDTYANDGLRVWIGSGLADFWWWTVGGRDKGRNPYGGWQNYAVDPSKTAGRTSVGSPSGAYRYFGCAADVTSAIAKGTMHGWDAIRYGRGEIYCTGTGATFAGLAQYNDYNDATNGYNRFGLFQEQGGSYLWKGLMSLGQSGTSVTFSDTNRVIFVDDTPHTYPTFNKIAIRNASSSITWNNIVFVALGTYAPGVFEVTENATVILNKCSFAGMSTFAFDSNSTINGCIFYRCGAITANEAVMTGSQVLESSVAADASALIWNDNSDPDGNLDNMIFSKGTNAHHAIQLGTSSPTTVTLRGITFTNFNASNGQNDSVVYLADRGSDTAWTINATSCTGTVSYKKARSGDTVNVVVNPVTTKIIVKNMAGTVISSARVLVEAGDGTGDLPFEESVTITRSGSTATVAHTAHGLVTNDKAVIRGAVQQEYNGVFQITKVNDNEYTYTVSGTPDSPATGTITATGAILEGTTDGSGEISASRSFTTDQNIRGTARKSTSAPYYKISDFTDVVDSVVGLTKTVQLVLDQ